jgi:curli biogenesis system outer membrane secretion channel CsgG
VHHQTSLNDQKRSDAHKKSTQDRPSSGYSYPQQPLADRTNSYQNRANTEAYKQYPSSKNYQSISQSVNSKLSSNYYSVPQSQEPAKYKLDSTGQG